jgi:hypothetical protein
MSLRALVLVGLFACLAVPAHAQQSVKIEFNNGQVTVVAQNAQVRAILAEWARLGGATVVNGDRVVGPPLTLELTRVPERQALDIILRSVAGYMLAPRAAGSTGASAYDRIMIMPTSTAPRAPAPTPGVAGAPRPLLPQPQLVRPARPVVAPDDDDDAQEEPEPSDQPVPVATPRPAPRVIAPPRPGQPPQPIGPDPQVEPDEFVPEPETPAPPPAVAPTPANPFGVPFGSTSRPGVVTPVPPQPQQQQPQQRQPGQQP